MRRALFALCLSFAAACSGSSPSSPPDRTIATFEPYLTRDLTPSATRERFGPPDEIVGSGLLIYKYRLDGGRTLWLWFPGFRPISFARIEAKDGSYTEVTLK